MTKLVPVLCGLAAVFAAAPALAQSAGYIGVGYGEATVSSPGGEIGVEAWAIEGQITWEASDDWTMTTVADVVHTPDSDITAGDVALHATTLIGGDLRLGGFVGVVSSNGRETVSAGLEAHKYFGDWTVGGVIAVARNDDADADLLGGRIQARYFVTPDFRIGASAGVSQVDAPAIDTDFSVWGLNAEYRFAGTPFSVSATYDRTRYDDFDVDVDFFTIGLRYGFGGDLRARDMAGAELITPLGAFGQTLGY